MNFYVFRFGVNLHGVWGPYSDRAAAERRIENLKAQEPDNYHRYEILSGIGDCLYDSGEGWKIRKVRPGFEANPTRAIA